MRKTPEEAERTRLAILDAAELLFLERGIATTTLEKISRAAGVTRGAFYWYFKDKSELLRALQERAVPQQIAILHAVAEEKEGDPFGLLEMTSWKFLEEFETNVQLQRIIEIMSTNPHFGEDIASFAEANAEVFGILLKIAQRAQEVGQLAPEFTPSEAAISLMVIMNGLLSEWLRSRKSFRLQELGAKLISCQIKALKVSSGNPCRFRPIAHEL